jgi:glycosyltransferase involved in cell wall biosynthesis
MRLTIVSNYINHHQTPMADELYKKLGADFSFIQTQPMEEERIRMGWGDGVGKIPYLKLFYETPEECGRLIMESDIVVFGGVEDEGYIKPRLKAGKIVIRASERLYREGQWKSISPRGRKKKYEDHTQYAQSPVYLLCHGAYVASDFEIVHAYSEKKFTWGYFPKAIEYNLEELFDKKRHFDNNGNRQIKLLWAGRFMKLKHPEYAIKAAKYLKENNIIFHLDMVGAGELEAHMKNITKKYGLCDNITFHGFKPPDKVRGFMEEADIFMFTSNHLEGWGAVLNEAMNSGCAVVAGAGIGATPYLIRHGRNGLVFKNENIREFKNEVLSLACNDELRKTLGASAYETIISEWNPVCAADRLYKFSEGLLNGRVITAKSGPLSPAPLISPRKGYAYAHRK